MWRQDELTCPDFAPSSGDTSGEARCSRLFIYLQALRHPTLSKKSLSRIGPGDYDREVRVQGWVEDVRKLGGIAFVILRQREGTLQLAFPKKKVPELLEMAGNLTRESVIEATGTVVKNDQARNGWEIIPRELKVLAAAEAPLPLGVVDKVTADADTRVDNRFLDLRKAEVRAIFEVRSLVLQSIRATMVRHGFTEVNTPKLSGAGAEGGASLFKTDYFGRVAYLSQSPQLYKQMLMASSLDRVFEIAQVFRAEPSDTVRHLTEITMFDAEMAYIDHQEDFFTVLEDAVVTTIRDVTEQAKPLLTAIGRQPKVPTLPFPRVPYSECIEILNQQGKAVKPGDDIDTEGEKLVAKVVAERGHELFFITEYPSSIKPFYVMRKDDDPGSTWSFDLEYKGDEMASGGQREHRIGQLIANMAARGLKPESFEFYLKAFRYGMPPHGGWGFGIDRFVQKMLDLPNIREAVLFPRDRNRLSP